MVKAICAVAALSCCLALSGCGGAVGLAVGAMGRSAGTSGEYTAWKSTMPGIPPGTGRLIVYIPARSFTLNAVEIGTGALRIFAIDSDVCGVIEAAFMYVDVPAGNHNMSTGDMEMLFGKFRRGKYETNVRVAGGGLTYVRIDIVDRHLAPRLIDAATAEEELAKLPLDTHFVSFECKKDAAQERGT